MTNLLQNENSLIIYLYDFVLSRKTKGKILFVHYCMEKSNQPFKPNFSLISRKKIIQVWNDSAQVKEIISGMSPGFGHTINFKVLFWIPLMPAVFLLQCIQEICSCLE